MVRGKVYGERVENRAPLRDHTHLPLDGLIISVFTRADPVVHRRVFLIYVTYHRALSHPGAAEIKRWK